MSHPGAIILRRLSTRYPHRGRSRAECLYLRSAATSEEAIKAQARLLPSGRNAAQNGARPR